MIEVSFHARNSLFFVVRRLETRWKIVGQFEGQDFSFRNFSSLLCPTFETVANYGGGHLEVTTYAWRDGRYVKEEGHEERVGEEPKKRRK